jgi:hypothetical protein
MSDHSRSTALDSDLLTAEMSLLLDYLSGLPERILTSQHGHLPPAARLAMTLSQIHTEIYAAGFSPTAVGTIQCVWTDLPR